MTAPAAPSPTRSATAPGRRRLTLVPANPRLRLLRHEPDPDVAPPRAPAPGPPRFPAVPDDLRETPDLRRRTHQVMCLVLEVLGGRRTIAHLVPHLAPQPLRYVRAACRQPTGDRPTRLTSLHIGRPCAGAVEVAAVVRTGRRSRVLVARLEGEPDEPAGWRCVTVRLL